MKQARAFEKGEGDAWYKRNINRLGGNDPVLAVLDQLCIEPKQVLEIGCSNGWRLDALYERYKCGVCGVEPSEAAIDDGPSDIWIQRGTAKKLAFRNGCFDMVIFGFCLYLVDREDLFRVVAEADRVLQDNGLLLIYDFYPPEEPYKVKYKHKEGLWSYHMNYSKIFLANPTYKSVMHYVHDEWDTMVSVLEKKLEPAYPERES